MYSVWALHHGTGEGIGYELLPDFEATGGRRAEIANNIIARRWPEWDGVALECQDIPVETWENIPESLRKYIDHWKPKQN